MVFVDPVLEDRSGLIIACHGSTSGIIVEVRPLTPHGSAALTLIAVTVFFQKSTTPSPPVFKAVTSMSGTGAQTDFTFHHLGCEGFRRYPWFSSADLDMLSTGSGVAVLVCLHSCPRILLFYHVYF